MKKQTAVQWLEKQLDFLNKYMSERDRSNLFDQAKAMERQQIEKAYDDAIMKGRQEYGNQYYNETCGVNNNDPWDEVINELGESNKMIDHIREVNEMVCMFEPRTHTSSATICKHCGKEKFLHDHVPDGGKMLSNSEIGKKRWDDWDEFNKKAYYPEDYRSAYADGFTRGAKWVNEIAKETLYTEEQVREAIYKAVSLTLSDKSSYPTEIIQSLKQPKQ